jgi:hypothetical protein
MNFFVKKKNLLFLLTIIIVGLLICWFTISKGYIISNKSAPNQLQTTTVTETPLIQQKKLIDLFGPFEKLSQHKSLSVDDIYPDEINKKNEKNLLDSRCTGRFTFDSEGQTYTGTMQDKPITGSIKELPAEITRYRNGYGNFSSIEYCEIKDNGELVIMQYSARGPTMIVWKAPSTTYSVTLANRDLNCSLIQITNKNIMYFHCKGGQGPTWDAIHRVDVKKINGEIIKFCTQRNKEAVQKDSYCIEDINGLKSIPIK